MRLVFAGTPWFAAVALEALLDAGHELVLVLTQPDRPAGRGRKLRPSPVKDLAMARGCRIEQPGSLRDGVGAALVRALDPEAMIVAAYGLLLPPDLLATPRLGCINIHASILPRWRGAAPVQRAILAGDAETGVSIMQMDVGLDTGPVFAVRRTAIMDDDTAETLTARLARIGAEAMVAALPAIGAKTLGAEAQTDAGACYAPKINREEAAVDWRLAAAVVARGVRAFDPVPGAHAAIRGETVKLWKAQPVSGGGAPGTVLSIDASSITIACGSGALRVLEMQRPGGRRMATGDVLRGFPLQPGERFEAGA